MCLIIDACCSHRLTTLPFQEGTTEILRWLEKGGKVATGGKNLFELFETRFRRIAIELERSGRLHKADDQLVDAEEVSVSARFQLRSNDPHVIALARISGARVLFTEDAALMDDFRDGGIVTKRGNRKGAIVQPSGSKKNVRACLNKGPACTV